MTWLLLGLGAWCAWLAINVHLPIRKPGVLAGASFVAGWLTGELAVYHLCVQAVLLSLLAVGGALHAWPGVVGAALTCGSWPALILAVRQSRRASEVMTVAIEAALGHPLPDAELPAFPRWRLALPFWFRRRGVERLRNVIYADDPRRLRLDIYRPADADRRGACPVLLYVHGGGWIIGSKNEQGLVLMNHLAAGGWLCLGINYRLSPRATFPAQVVDVKRAIAWTREHIADYGGDASFVALSGGSAGGHLAALAALTPNDATLQPGFEEADTAVQACVPLYGVFDLSDRFGHWPNRHAFRWLLELLVIKRRRKTDPEAFRAASPVSHVNEDAPPFLVIQGDRDSLVPTAEARRFCEALGEVSRAPCAYAELPGAQHVFDLFPSPRSVRTVEGIGRFLQAVFRSHRAVPTR